MSIAADGAVRPDFIIIGAMRAGTTTIDRILRAHPEVGMSRDKETDFFILEKNFSKGLDWYSGQFDVRAAVHGEASPNYSKADDFTGVPERIAGVVPGVRLVYVVRDPVQRAVSQYNHRYAMGAPLDPPDAFPDTHEYHHVIRTSAYARQLEAFLEHFAAEQILVMDFDALVADPAGAMASLYTHIGVGAPAAMAGQSHNESAEMARISPLLLRFGQSPPGRALNRVIGRRTRDRLRRILARGAPRRAPPFPDAVLARMRNDLAADAARFRTLTGRSFESWSV